MRSVVASSSPGLRAVVAAGVVGLVVGALLGGVAGALRHPVWTATSLLSLAPDPVVASNPAGVGSSPSDSQITSSLQTQLVYLSSAAFTRTVQQKVGGAPVFLQATEVQTSSVVQLEAQDASPQRARRVARSAVALYARHRTDQVNGQLDRQSQALQAQMDQTDQALDSLPTASTADAGAITSQRNALEGQYASLLAQSGAVASARRTTGDLVTQLQGADVAAAGGLAPTVSLGVAGATVGLLVALAGLLLYRRLSLRVVGSADVERYGLPVLSPEVPHRRLRAGQLDDEVLQRVVAAQAPRLSSSRSGIPGLVVVGPTAGVGASSLALQHAVYAARRGEVLLVRTPDPEERGLRQALGVQLSDRVLQLPDEPLSVDVLDRLAHPSTLPGLRVLTLGRDEAEGPAMLEDALAAGLLDAARGAGWEAVVDAPALDVSTAGLLGARGCGASLVVAAAGRTTRSELEAALDGFAAWRLTPSALVVNHPRTRGPARSALARLQRGEVAPERLPVETA